METEAPDSFPVTICSLIWPPGLSYLLGLALPRAAPTPGEQDSFLEGPMEEALQAPQWRQDLSSQKRPGGGDGTAGLELDLKQEPRSLIIKEKMQPAGIWGVDQ